MKQVVVLDYGFGNVRSAVRALEHVGADVELTADTRLAAVADGLVVPGVGAFTACVEGLRGVGGDLVVADRVQREAPVLGICVGMQVLFDRGVEHGRDAAGLGLLPGTVEKLDAAPLPHMGWNTVTAAPGTDLFSGLEDQRFYFVHSYGIRTADAAAVGERDGLDGPARRVTIAEHGGDTFWAAVEDGPLIATQFHPEKSGDAGLALLAGWVDRL